MSEQDSLAIDRVMALMAESFGPWEPLRGDHGLAADGPPRKDSPPWLAVEESLASM